MGILGTPSRSVMEFRACCLIAWDLAPGCGKTLEKLIPLNGKREVCFDPDPN